METLQIFIIFIIAAALIGGAILFLCKENPQRNDLLNKINHSQSMNELHKQDVKILHYLESENNWHEHHLFMDTYNRKAKRLAKNKKDE